MSVYGQMEEYNLQTVINFDADFDMPSITIIQNITSKAAIDYRLMCLNWKPYNAKNANIW